MVTKYLLIWFLLAVVAIPNGVIRQTTYGKSVSDLAAHQISTITAILASGTVVWVVHRFWPIESASQAWTIGLLWLVMTIAFQLYFFTILLMRARNEVLEREHKAAWVAELSG